MGKKDRPAYWGKKYVLTRVRGGDAVLHLCREVGEMAGIEAEALEQEVHRWRDADPEFHDAMSQHVVSKGGGRPSLEDGQDRPDWKVLFLEAFAQCGLKMKAAAQARVSYQTVYDHLSEKGQCFDKQFKAAFERVETEVMAKVEDVVYSDALKKKNPWTALKILAVRAPKKWGVQIKVQQSGVVKHEHTHSLSPVDRDLLMGKIENEWGKLFDAKPGPRLIEGEVVDVSVENSSSSDH